MRRLTFSTARWLACAAVLALAACGSGAELVSETDGPPPWRTAFIESAAYVAGRDSNAFHVVLIDPAGQPHRAGHLRVPGRIDAMAARGTHVFLGITLHQNALQEPLTQEWISRGWLRIDERFSADGKFVGGSNLVVLDVSNPAQPRAVSAVSTTPQPGMTIRQIVLDAGRAFLVTGRGVWLADISDPLAPRLLDRVSATGERVSVAGRLYVAQGEPGTDPSSGQRAPGGFTIVDASSPSGARVLGGLDGRALGLREDAGVVEASVEVLATGENHVYLDAEVTAGQRTRDFLVTVDVSDPARPREVARVEVDFLDGLLVRGRTLYAYGSAGSRALLRVYDLSNPAAPRETGRYDLDESTDIGSIGNLEPAGGLLYVQNDSRGVSVFRLPR